MAKRTTETLRKEILETMDKLRAGKISVKEARSKTTAANKELRQLRAHLRKRQPAEEPTH
jgi:hypothetical protein